MFIRRYSKAYLSLLFSFESRYLMCCDTQVCLRPWQDFHMHFIIVREKQNKDSEVRIPLCSVKSTKLAFGHASDVSNGSCLVLVWSHRLFCCLFVNFFLLSSCDRIGFVTQSGGLWVPVPLSKPVTAMNRRGTRAEATRRALTFKTQGGGKDCIVLEAPDSHRMATTNPSSQVGAWALYCCESTQWP